MMLAIDLVLRWVLTPATGLSANVSGHLDTIVHVGNLLPFLF